VLQLVTDEGEKDIHHTFLCDFFCPELALLMKPILSCLTMLTRITSQSRETSPSTVRFTINDAQTGQFMCVWAS